MSNIDDKTNSTMCYCPDCGATTRASYHLDMDCKTIQQLRSDNARLRSELSTQETFVDTLEEQKYAWDELVAERDKYRRAIQELIEEITSREHHVLCSAKQGSLDCCSCGKRKIVCKLRDALKEVDKNVQG